MYTAHKGTWDATGQKSDEDGVILLTVSLSFTCEKKRKIVL